MSQRALVGRAALIVIDMQEGAYGTTSGIPRMGGFSERVQRVCQLIAHFRASGSPVIFVREEHRRSFVDFGRELDGNESVHCLEGESDTEIAHQHDYVARVVVDCCGGSSSTAHEAALNAMAYLQKDAQLTSAELLAPYIALDN